MQIQIWKLMSSNEDNFYCELFGTQEEAEKAYIEAVYSLQDNIDEMLPEDMTFKDAKDEYSYLVSNGDIIGSMQIEVDTVVIPKDGALAALQNWDMLCELNKRGHNLQAIKPIYKVVIDHVDGPCVGDCDTEHEAKSYILGYVEGFKTLEEFDAALKDSLSAIDGVIHYSIVKHTGDKKETIAEA